MTNGFKRFGDDQFFPGSCMMSLREPLLEAELNRDRKSSLLLFATEIMVRARSSLLLFKSIEKMFSRGQVSLSNSTGHTTCNPTVPLRAPVLQFSEEKHPDGQQAV